MEGMLTADFPDVTIEERQVRNTMQSLKGNSNTNATRQCRRLLERLLEVQHNEDPDMIIVQLLDEEDRLKGVFWELLLAKYPQAEIYLNKRLGSSFARWNAPWLQVFTASSFASSREEGANKDYKHGVLLKALTLEEAYEQVTKV
eukprot:jgi/Tetstr1/466294/TSEL_010827.t1